jgi:glutamate formiminotransferase/formiminotetrahydrofolate cyclodeaminase
LPVYFYERAATRETRRSLAVIREGEYDGLQAKLTDPEWTPDCGPAVFNPRLGATVVGAREFLIAYNVNLNTRDRRLATGNCVEYPRDGTSAERDEHGDVVGTRGRDFPPWTPGRLKATRAIGWYIDAISSGAGVHQPLDFRTTPLHVVFETVRDEADRLGSGSLESSWLE